MDWIRCYELKISSVSRRPLGQATHHPVYAPRLVPSPPPVASSSEDEDAKKARAPSIKIKVHFGNLIRVLVLLTLLVLAILFLGFVTRQLRSRRARLLFLRRKHHEIEVEEQVPKDEPDEKVEEELVWVPQVGWTSKSKSSHLIEEVESTSVYDTLDLEWGDWANFGQHMFSVSQSDTLEQSVQEALENAWKFRKELRKYDGDPKPIAVRLMGQRGIIKRDSPLMKRGYEFASNHIIFDPTPVEDEAGLSEVVVDVLLCFSLSTCSAKDDLFSTFFEHHPGARVNRIPNLRGVLWSKQNFCYNIPSWLAEIVSFPCWVLPDQESELLDVAKKQSFEKKWIAKPWSSGGGHGISVASNLEELSTIMQSGRNLVVQPFLNEPLLVMSKKIDLRVYVLVTSTYPIRAYVHERGLVRFASQAYDATKESFVGTSRGQFLTNTSVNKKESNATAAELTWSFSSLFEALAKKRSRQIRLGIDRAIALILLAVESKFPRRDIVDGSRFHLLGVDVIIPEKEAAPRIIEVNGEPSFARASSSPTPDPNVGHYESTKVIVARDILTIVLHPLTERIRSIAISMLRHLEDNPAFTEYLLEWTREQHAATEFRPCYPSPVAAAYKDQDSNLFIRVLEREGEPNRLKLHQIVSAWERKRLRDCYTDASCRGGIRSVLDDLLGEGLKFTD